MAEPIRLIDLSYEQLAAWLADQGEPAFRAHQIFEWLYRALVADFSGMTNLPAALRTQLAEGATLQSLVPLETVTSADALTTKVLFRLPDGEMIESVWMQYEGRQTVCVSSQVGCALGCPFCATGQSGFKRNLSSGEIVEQVLYFARQMHEHNETLSNVVFMGMGEPLMNYDAVWDAVRRMNDARGMGLGARRFTLSTAGVVPGIRRMAEEDLSVGLAVSLHAAEDRLRNRLVPLNQRYPLPDLIAACREYAEHTSRRVSFEYALIQEVNDSIEQARQLGHLLHGWLCHVNLIPLNTTAGCPYQASRHERVMAFRAELNRLGVGNTVRLGRGSDIQAGCGQLRSRHATLRDK